MCKPTITNDNNQGQSAPHDIVTRNVIVSGAGPSGLLLTALLLNHNRQQQQQQQQQEQAASTTTTATPNNNNICSHIRYQVTLLESRSDLGQLDVQRDLPSKRSWMIGLAGHGLNALRTLPKLYNDYVQQPHVGVELQTFTIYLGATKMENRMPQPKEDSQEDMDKSTKKNNPNEAYIVDRNYVVAAMSRYLHDHHGDDPYLTMRYQTQLQYVDAPRHRILARDVNTQDDEYYLPYDLLVGADGARSVVRQALVAQVYDFEMDYGDIFNQFRAVHVTKPASLNADGMSLLPACLPGGMNGICLPMPPSAANGSTGNKEEEERLVNISIGCPRHAKVAPELESNDVQVVADYFQKHFKAFELVDYHDFAKKWIGGNGQKWNRTAQVHCNQYHSCKGKLAIMGDAAHATSPSIGMGMNTALRDAASLYRILVQQEEKQVEEAQSSSSIDKTLSWDDDQNLDRVLTEFSNQRVREGQSLTDLAFHLYCLDETAQGMETLHMIVRGALHGWFPSLVSPHPQMLIGNPQYDLRDVYQLASQTLKIIPKHRAINDKIRQEYLEERLEMVPASPPKNWGVTVLLGLAGLSVAGMALGMKLYSTPFP